MAQSWAIGGATFTYGQSYFADPSGFFSVAPVPSFRPALNGGRYGLLTALDPALGGNGGAKLARVYCEDNGSGNYAVSGQFSVPSGYASHRGSIGISKLLRSAGTDGSDGHYRWGVHQEQKSLYIGRGENSQSGRIYRADTGAATSWNAYIAMWAAADEVPTAPGRPSLDTSAPSMVTITWSPPADNGGRAITGYRAQVSTDSGFNAGLPSVDTGPTVTAATVANLAPATTYYVRVLARNGVSDAAGTFSVASDVVAFTTLANPPSAPGVPSVTSPAAGLLAASWTAPTSNGGKPITGYELDIATDPNFMAGLQSFAQTSQSRTIEGLTPGARYYARVRAKNVDKTGPNSATAEVTLRAAAPGVPTGLAVTTSTGGKATVVWDAPSSTGGKPVTYEVQVSTNPAFPGQATNAYTAPGPPLDLTGLLAGRTYYVRVRARNEDATGLYTATVSARMPSGAHTSEGGAWDTAEVYICVDGVTWEPAEVLTSDGATWTPAE